jgi:integrase
LPPPAKAVPLTTEDRALKRAFRPLYDKSAPVRQVRERIAAALASDAAKLSLVGRMLGRWVLHLLSHQTKRRRLATVSRYVQPVRRYALPELRSSDPDAYTDEQWEARLQDAIDNAGDSMAPLAIYLFARFISAQPDGPIIDPDELEGIESVHRVRANLLSVADFDRAMQRLDAPTERERRMAQLVGALGFYSGLRRGEALHLRLGDISGRARPHLLVRGNRHHRLKRFSSQRVLPLFALLPPHWLTELMSWLERRDAEGRSRSRDRLLFCAPGKQFLPLAAEVLTTPVRDAIRAATGDQGLVYHHLRHSFGNWTLVRLMSPELPLPQWRRTFAAFDDPWFADPACQSLRSVVLGGRQPDLPARHAAYALSRLLGHGSVATSWRSYLHLGDLLALGIQGRDRPLALADGEVQVLLGLGVPGGPVDGAYHRWRRLHRKAWSEALNGLDAEVILDRARRDTLGYDDGWERAEASSPAVLQDVSDEQRRALWLDEVPALLGMLFRDRPTVQHVAERLSLDPVVVQRLKTAATRLADERTIASGKRRFRMPPQPPSGQADGDALSVVLARVEQPDMDWRSVRAGIDLLRRADPSRGHRIMLSDPDDAKRFAAMLEALGFPRKDLRADLYPRPEATDENLAFWADQLGIQADAIALKNKRVPKQAVQGMIAIGATTPRRFSRHEDGEEIGGLLPYDPAKAGATLELLSSAADEHASSWRLQHAEEADALAWLLGWFGVDRSRIAVAAERCRITLDERPLLDQATRARALGVLAKGKPHHDLRMVSADMGDITAAIELLLAGGVDASLLYIDLTGEWTQEERDGVRKRLIDRFHQLA